MSRGRPEASSYVQRLEEAEETLEEFVEKVLVDVNGEPANNAKKRKLGRTTIHDLRKTFAMGRRTFGEADRVIAEVKRDLEQERVDRKERSERWDGDEAARDREEAREDVRTVLEAEERRRAMRRDDVLLVLTVISVLATIAMAVITVKHREPWYLGASLVGALFSGGGVLVLRAERSREL